MSNKLSKVVYTATGKCNSTREYNRQLSGKRQVKKQIFKSNHVCLATHKVFPVFCKIPAAKHRHGKYSVKLFIQETVPVNAGFFDFDIIVFLKNPVNHLGIHSILCGNRKTTIQMFIYGRSQIRYKLLAFSNQHRCTAFYLFSHNFHKRSRHQGRTVSFILNALEQEFFPVRIFSHLKVRLIKIICILKWINFTHLAGNNQHRLIRFFFI